MSFPKKFTVLHRMLHWVMALAMPVLFITGFLRMYWMNRSHISTIVDSNVPSVTRTQMSAITTAIREPMWQWHELFSKVMIIAFIIRIAYMVIKGIRFPNPFKAHQPLKERMQGLSYVYFYLFVFISAFTGVCIENNFFEAYMENIETVHKWGLYWFPIFIILHFSGILIAELTNKKGISSAMIGGD